MTRKIRGYRCRHPRRRPGTPDHAADGVDAAKINLITSALGGALAGLLVL